MPARTARAARRDSDKDPEALSPSASSTEEIFNSRTNANDAQQQETAEGASTYATVIGIIVGIAVLIGVGGGVWYYTTRKPSKEEPASALATQ